MPDKTTPAKRQKRSVLKRSPKLLEVVISTVVLLIVAIGSLFLMSGSSSPSQVTMTVVNHDITHGLVKSATLYDDNWSIVLTLKDGHRVTSGYPSTEGQALTNELVRRDVKTTVVPLTSAPWWHAAVTEMFFMLVILGGAYVLITQQGNGVKKFGQNKSNVVDVPDTRFSDVAGANEPIAELTELVEFLRNPKRFHDAGARIPKGILLVGPPGTGKTLMARAVAGEADVPFFSLSGSDFVETFVGVGASRVREIFNKGRKAGRAIIFIDEIDAVGKTRTNGASNGASEERENTLNQMLVEMDGFDTSGVIVLAATNRPDVLDSALTRSGRFDRQIIVPLPDRTGRLDILRLVAGRRKLDETTNLDSLSRRTKGLSGADLDYLMNEASLEAARAGRTVISEADLNRALETKRLGKQRLSAVVSDEDSRIVAWHEAGHTVVALLEDKILDPVVVSVIPRGTSGGATWMEEGDNDFVPRTVKLQEIEVLMGGRAAEMLLLNGDVTQGSSNDLQVATQAATEMVALFGMTSFGLSVVNPSKTDDVTAHKLRDAVNEILERAQTRATAMLEENVEVLAAVATALLEDDTLDRDAIQTLKSALGNPDKALALVKDQANKDHVTRIIEKCRPKPVALTDK
jgi:cell division protease FtsH